jgi:hypothetical protein
MHGLIFTVDYTLIPVVLLKLSSEPISLLFGVGAVLGGPEYRTILVTMQAMNRVVHYHSSSGRMMVRLGRAERRAE